MLWRDEVIRDGPENMAIDEWLWRNMAQPLLRVYRWQSDWLSIGYFSSCAELPEKTSFVRRPTGGGVVEHGTDWPYTLIIPRGHALAEMTGAASYRIIHQALVAVLLQEGVRCQLQEESVDHGAGFCFRHPVVHDVIDPSGGKLAGAGQRRGKWGLLHQGSLRCPEGADFDRGQQFAMQLAEQVCPGIPEIDWDWVHCQAEQLYRSAAWNDKK